MDINELIKLLNDSWSSPQAVGGLILVIVPCLAGAITGIIKVWKSCNCRKKKKDEEVQRDASNSESEGEHTD